jgi:hypothetical protein
VYEIKHRIATTEIGQLMLDLDKDSVFQNAYGTMYLSLRYGLPFCRIEYEVCGEG